MLALTPASARLKLGSFARFVAIAVDSIADITESSERHLLMKGESFATICRRLEKGCIRVLRIEGGRFMNKARILLSLASVAAGTLMISAAFRPAAIRAVASVSGLQSSP